MVLAEPYEVSDTCSHACELCRQYDVMYKYLCKMHSCNMYTQTSRVSCSVRVCCL